MRPTTPTKQHQEIRLRSFSYVQEEGFSYIAGNRYIRDGYRLNYSIYECLKSLFQLHNETLNVWTHMVGAGSFMGLVVMLTIQAREPNSSIHRRNCVQVNNLYMIHGHHTMQLFARMALDQVASPTCGSVHIGISASLFDQGLHRIPHILNMTGALSENEEYDAEMERLQDQMELVRDEAKILRTKLAKVSESGAEWVARPLANKILLVREKLQARTQTLSEFIQTLRYQFSTRPLVQAALEEHHLLTTTFTNGINMISVIDPILSMNDPNEHNVPKWPIIVFLVCTTICFVSSATFHLLYVHSQTLYYLLARMDYAGIAIMIAGSFYPFIYYSFYCHPHLWAGYLGSISTLATATTIMALTPAFSNPDYDKVRVAVFGTLCFVGIIPIGHLMYKYGVFDEHITAMLAPLALMSGALYMVGAAFYATKFPESRYPGKFDLWFSSHQVWHVCIVVAALLYYISAVQHHEWREATECRV